MSRLATFTHPLLAQEVINRVNNENIFTLSQFLESDTTYLSNVTNLTFKQVSLIKKHLCNKHSSVVFNGNELYASYMKRTGLISTGYDSFDQLLGGGFCTGKIYEICGLPSSGKTLFCSNFLLHYTKVSQQKILIFDTKVDFSLINVKACKETKNESILKRILFSECYSIQDLISSLHKVKYMLMKDVSIKFIIIDSLPSLLYQNLDSCVRNALLNYLVNITRLLAVKFNLTFIFVNSITTWRNSVDGVFCETNGCGKYWANVPNTVLKFTSIKSAKIKIEILRSSDLQQGGLCEISFF